MVMVGVVSMSLANQIEALSAAATPGPWFTLDPPWLPSDSETSILAESPDPHVARFICDFDLWAALDDEADADRKSQNPDGDATLIVALRNAVPQIVAALRAADEVEALRADNKFLSDSRDIAAKAILEDTATIEALRAALVALILAAENAGWSYNTSMMDKAIKDALKALGA